MFQMGKGGQYPHAHRLASFLQASMRIRPLSDLRASQVKLVVNNPHANAGGLGDLGFDPGSEGSPGGGALGSSLLIFLSR